MSASSRSPIALIADDNPVACQLVSTSLKLEGFVVLPHADGLSALKYLALGAPADVLVTDIRMSGAVDGLMLANRARDLRPRLPIVYMSGQNADRGAMQPGSQFVSKPFQVAYIASAVRDAIASAATLGQASDILTIRSRNRRRF